MPDLGEPALGPRQIDIPETGGLNAVNPADGLLYVLVPGADRIDVLDAKGKPVDTYDMSSIELVSPVAMTFAPSTDATDDPAELNLYVAHVGDDTTLGGITEMSLAPAAIVAAALVDTATLVQTIQTSSWSPAAPDPSGITWIPSSDRLVVVDSEVDETTGAGWHNVNLWRSSRTGTVAGVGTLWGTNAAQGGFSREPTGAGYDPGSNTLFVSDDSVDAVFVIRPGSDGVFGTVDDSVGEIDTGASPIAASDTEDPEFDTVSGDLFFLSGVDREIFRVNPVDSIFGNGNDTVTHFDISHLGPTDFEGLASAPSKGTLYVGARAKSGGVHKIFEITHDGTLVRTINVSVPAMSFISGLAVAPATNSPSAMSLWIVDRAVDNGANSNENDGKIFEISAPNIGGPAGNQAPVVEAGPDQSVPLGNPATLNGSVSDDGLPAGGQTTQTWSKVSGPGTVTFANPGAASTTATFGSAGSYVLALTASDGQLNASDQLTVTVQAATNSAPVIQPIADVVVAEGATVVVPISVSDPDGDALTITVGGLPAFGSFNSSAPSITFSPTPGDAGNYGPVTVTASDGATGGGQAPAFRSAASAINTGTSASALTIAKPSGVQAGDLLLAQIRHRGPTPNLTAPAGWTQVGVIADSSASHHSVLYKIAGPSEPTSYSFNQNTASGRIAGGIGAYTGVDPSDPIDAWAASPSRTTTLVAPTATATVPNTRVVRLWGWRGPSATSAGVGANVPPAGVAQRWSQQTGGSNSDRNRVLAGDHVRTQAGAVGASTASGSASTSEQNRSAFTVILAPAGGGLTASTSFDVTVTAAPGTNQVPVAVNDAATTAADTAVAVNVLANDTDADGDPLTVTNLSDPAHGAAAVGPGASVTYTPDPGYSGTDTFTYRASDGVALSNVATVTITVEAGPPGGGAAPTFRAAASAIDTGTKASVLTIAKPAGTQPGDLLLAQIRYRGSTSNLTAPAGWTQVGVIADSSNANHSVFYKIAGASEPASYAFNQGVAAGRMAGGIGAYSGVDPNNPINVWAASAAKTSSLTAPSVVTTVANTRVVRLWGWRGSSATAAGVGLNAPPAGIAERWSQQVGHANDDRNRVLAGDHVQLPVGAVGTATASGSQSSGEQNRSSFTIVLTPAP